MQVYKAVGIALCFSCSNNPTFAQLDSGVNDSAVPKPDARTCRERNRLVSGGDCGHFGCDAAIVPDASNAPDAAPLPFCDEPDADASLVTHDASPDALPPITFESKLGGGATVEIQETLDQSAAVMNVYGWLTRSTIPEDFNGVLPPSGGCLDARNNPDTGMPYRFNPESSEEIFAGSLTVSGGPTDLVVQPQQDWNSSGYVYDWAWVSQGNSVADYANLGGFHEVLIEGSTEYPQTSIPMTLYVPPRWTSFIPGHSSVNAVIPKGSDYEFTFSVEPSPHEVAFVVALVDSATFELTAFCAGPASTGSFTMDQQWVDALPNSGLLLMFKVSHRLYRYDDGMSNDRRLDIVGTYCYTGTFLSPSL